jgi:hypothetical protein
VAKLADDFRIGPFNPYRLSRQLTDRNREARASRSSRGTRPDEIIRTLDKENVMSKKLIAYLRRRELETFRNGGK